MNSKNISGNTMIELQFENGMNFIAKSIGEDTNEQKLMEIVLKYVKTTFPTAKVDDMQAILLMQTVIKSFLFSKDKFSDNDLAINYLADLTYCFEKISIESIPQKINQVAESIVISDMSLKDKTQLLNVLSVGNACFEYWNKEMEVKEYWKKFLMPEYFQNYINIPLIVKYSIIASACGEYEEDKIEQDILILLSSLLIVSGVIIFKWLPIENIQKSKRFTIINDINSEFSKEKPQSNKMCTNSRKCSNTGTNTCVNQGVCSNECTNKCEIIKY